MNNKTFQPKLKDVKRNWHLIDANSEVLGRLSTRVAALLMGKHKANYSDHMDMGDYVVVINAKDVSVTGKKESQKVYKRHSGYPGGFKSVSYAKWLSEAPEKIIEHAVSGMLPKNRLQKKRLRRMKVFAGNEHKYESHLKGSEKAENSGESK